MTALPQGDIGLLETSTSQRLLTSPIPARCAYIAKDGTPRVVPSWFQWTGDELAMPTFISAPHVTRPAARIAALTARPEVAVTIDTETFPSEVLLIRGRAAVAEVDGVDPDYARAAHRYLGDDDASAYLAQIDQPGTRMARIAVQPRWVGLIDFQSRLPAALGGVQGGDPERG